MAINDITLSSSMRSNLLSLKSTSELLDRTQERLSTGKKVNSALDNPTSFFTAQSLNARASDLNNLLDSMGQAVQTLKAADEGITTLTALVEQAKSITDQAASTSVGATNVVGALTLSGDPAVTASTIADDLTFTVGETDVTVAKADLQGKTAEEVVTAINTALTTAGIAEETAKASLGADGASFTITSDTGDAITMTENTDLGVAASEAKEALETYQNQYNNLLIQIDQLVQDTSYKGINLLNGDNLTVNFNETRTSTLLIEGVTFDSAGLGLASAESWNDVTKLNDSIIKTEDAINTLRAQASTFGQNLSVVQTRQDFTESMINILTSGADELTLADMNEEAANMLALQTRQSLGTNALSMASQAEQSVLQLF
ncbi:MAG: hypothetical protein IKD08_05855 [Alphaproteobacteria bacterium]|nr:hypothetical protein [Alphaproteobacteria bacterium]